MKLLKGCGEFSTRASIQPVNIQLSIERAWMAR